MANINKSKPTLSLPKDKPFEVTPEVTPVLTKLEAEQAAGRAALQRK